jgi:hypothetical protein
MTADAGSTPVRPVLACFADAGAASAAVNKMQRVGGSLGTTLLSAVARLAVRCGWGRS